MLLGCWPTLGVFNYLIEVLLCGVAESARPAVGDGSPVLAWWAVLQQFVNHGPDVILGESLMVRIRVGVSHRIARDGGCGIWCDRFGEGRRGRLYWRLRDVRLRDVHARDSIVQRLVGFSVIAFPNCTPIFERCGRNPDGVVGLVEYRPVDTVVTKGIEGVGYLWVIVVRVECSVTEEHWLEPISPTFPVAVRLRRRQCE
ncbi:hypothetical protein [Halorussus caseinilyticus]|uniref:Secreted protein n=1 Tax=Halorussus caseinilyticus TaxID=3034025 RepID=A0ABD5WGU0_9EURY